MKKLLIVAAALEALTGAALLIYPLLVIKLLFNSETTGAGIYISRIAGVSLIALGVSCWPSTNTLRAFLGMLTYGLLATLCLVYAGVKGEVGILLWPGVAVHAALSALLVSAWREQTKKGLKAR